MNMSSPLVPESSRGFFTTPPDPKSHLRLICFPHAGGSAALFHNWAAGLPAGVQVCAVHLPGRAERWREPPFTALPSLLEALIPTLFPYLDLPFALFGYSLGACVAFEMARLLRARGVEPVRLFVAAHRPPHLPNPLSPSHCLPELDFIQEMARRYEPVPQAVLQDAETRALFLGALRADMQMLETQVSSTGEPLACPISAFRGSTDSQVSDAELAAWGELTTGAVRSRVIPGGHFFVKTSRHALLEAVAADLSGI
jgi:surfactin synthase thioesterase subunit